MKTRCDNCSARYEIPDARAVGKVLRVRCQRCQNVMMVIGPTQAFSEGDATPPTLTGVQAFTTSAGHADASAGTARVREDLTPLWWVGISGKPHGPYTRQEVLALIDRGDVHARSRVWRRPWQQWERICESPLLAWAFERAIARVAEDAALMQGREASCVFEQSALLSDGEGWFPDPTLKSGWLILDEETQAYLETCARRGLLAAAAEEDADARPRAPVRSGSSVSLSGLPPPRAEGAGYSWRPALAAASLVFGLVVSGLWWWNALGAGAA